MGEKLVMYCRGPKETTVKYNRYVVNRKLFYTFVIDIEKRNHNSGVCVLTINGKTYYGKLTQIIEVEYYDRTKYVLFKFDWADNTRDKGYRLDKNGIMLVNFKNLIYIGEWITNEPFVLTSQVDQVFYIKDEMNPDWACIVRTKPRNVYDVGQGQELDNDSVSYHEIESFLLSGNHDVNPLDDVDYIRPNLPPIEAYVI
jgi:hypothetical protein